MQIPVGGTLAYHAPTLTKVAVHLCQTKSMDPRWVDVLVLASIAFLAFAAMLLFDFSRRIKRELQRINPLAVVHVLHERSPELCFVIFTRENLECFQYQ